MVLKTSLKITNQDCFEVNPQQDHQSMSLSNSSKREKKTYLGGLIPVFPKEAVTVQAARALNESQVLT